MQQDLWGDTIQPPNKQTNHRETRDHTVTLTPLDCLTYGHSWHTIGLANEKQCSVCGIKGYCPGCTPIPPANARPFFCTRHSHDRTA